MWTHRICEPCWIALNGSRMAVRMKPEHATNEWCCFCGDEVPGAEGAIYVREDPAKMSCANLHEHPVEETT